MSPQALDPQLISEKGKLHSKEPFVWLIEFPLFGTTAARLALWPRDINIFEDVGGTIYENTYHGFSFGVPEVSLSAGGELGGATLTLADVRMDLLSYIQGVGAAMKGKDLRLMLVHTSALGDAESATPYALSMSWQIMKLQIREGRVRIDLGHTNLTDVDVPGEDFQRDYCRFIFGDARCAFPAATAQDGYGQVVDGFPLSPTKKDSCDHTKDGPNGCRAHAALAKIQGLYYMPRFGGQPGLVKGKGV